MSNLRFPITALLLFVLAVIDWKNKRVNRVVLLLFCVGIFCCSLFDQFDLLSRLLGIGLGGIMILMSFFSKEALGRADGILLLTIGASAGFTEAAILSFLSFTLAAVYSGGMLLLKKLRRGDQIPFFPFILAGYLVTELFRREVFL